MVCVSKYCIIKCNLSFFLCIIAGFIRGRMVREGKSSIKTHASMLRLHLNGLSASQHFEQAKQPPFSINQPMYITPEQFQLFSNLN